MPLFHLFDELIVKGLNGLDHLSLSAKKLVCVSYDQNIWHSFWPDSKKQILCLDFSILAQPEAQDGVRCGWRTTCAIRAVDDQVCGSCPALDLALTAIFQDFPDVGSRRFPGA
jgi:hypothetical protein